MPTTTLPFRPPLLVGSYGRLSSRVGVEVPPLRYGMTAATSLKVLYERKMMLVGHAPPTSSSFQTTPPFPFPTHRRPSFRSGAREARASAAEEPQPLPATASNRSCRQQ
ncbi:MAG: hypothetical protein LBH84_03960 [Prevotellaceae bacterium]|nr:hypothetical protein [Prevotellaceae bacterium]